MGSSLIEQLADIRLYSIHELVYYIMMMSFLQEVHTREQNMKVEERSKAMAGTGYENTRRGLEQTLKSKQERAQARLRQGWRWEVGSY